MKSNCCNAGKIQRIVPVPFTDVKLEDGFWSKRIATNREVTIPYSFGKCEEFGRMSNFEIAAGRRKGLQKGIYPFDDTDVYKILEGASFSLAVSPDKKLDAYLDKLIKLIADAQEDDGYLFTPRSNNAKDLKLRIGDRRWEMEEKHSHELYNAGHLIEAAVAHYQSTGKRTLLDVAVKFADLLCRVFGPGKRKAAPGHQIIEMALARLYAVTGERKYVELAKFFLDARGPGGESYSQCDKRVVDQTEAVGHAVRAVYMYSGMADVASLAGEDKYLKAIDAIWKNVVSRKLYLNGGIGAHHNGEKFGANYELPNFSAYCETCAAIGNVYWNHRLFLLHGDAKYIDVMERSLYNGIISGLSMDGKEFFYPNPLNSYGESLRSAWFGCSCCPGNLTRFISSLPGYVYAVKGSMVYVNLFVAGRAELRNHMRDSSLFIEQKTRHPWEGDVEIRITPVMAGKFAVALRIPGWARNQPVPSDLYRYIETPEEPVTIKVNGRPVPYRIQKGYAVIERLWNPGDRISLHLPMPARRVVCNPKVKDNRGRVAIERGPLVYCLEWPDNDNHVFDVQLARNPGFKVEHRKNLLGDVSVIRGRGTVFTEDCARKKMIPRPVELVAIPYYAWCHRGRGEMAVWIAHEKSAVIPKQIGSVVHESRIVISPNGAMQKISSGRTSHKYVRWNFREGNESFVEFHFREMKKISRFEVLWFDETDNRDRQWPDSWALSCWDGKSWKPVESPSGYGIERDQFNVTRFKPVETRALRLDVKFQSYGGGILDCRIG